MIKYREGYKYQLAENAGVKLPFPAPPIDTEHEFITITPSGQLIAEQGYAWDGASGPTIDTKSSMRASLFHDVLCQLMREGLLDREIFSPLADALFRDICIEDGMFVWRANSWHYFLRKFGKAATMPRPDEVLTAP